MQHALPSSEIATCPIWIVVHCTEIKETGLDYVTFANLGNALEIGTRNEGHGAEHDVSFV